MTRLAGRSTWLVILVVVVVTLAIGALGERAPRTEAERVASIASEVRCPTCAGLSAAESDAIAAQAVRDAIRDGIRSGRSDREIRAFLVSRYGEEILLKPGASGFSALVWVLPVAAGVIAAAALVIVFRRWRKRPTVEPSEADRALVAEALSR